MNDHSSRTTIARRLKQPTRESSGTNRAAVSVLSRSSPHALCSLLGFAPSGVYRARSVTRSAVRSYRTVSPLPRDPLSELAEAKHVQRTARRFIFCGTFPVLTDGGRYPPLCSAEPGLSSANSRRVGKPNETANPQRSLSSLRGAGV